jgi:hypothetical protein
VKKTLPDAGRLHPEVPAAFQERYQAILKQAAATYPDHKESQNLLVQQLLIDEICRFQPYSLGLLGTVYTRT